MPGLPKFYLFRENVEGTEADLYIEGKAVNGILHLNSSGYQILGEIDAVKNSRTGNAIPQLAFVTTQNTIIGDDIIRYAESNRVFLTQYIVSSNGEGDIKIGTPQQLNMWNREFLAIPIPGIATLIGPPGPDNAYDQEEVEDLP